MGKATSSDPTTPPVHGEILTGVQRRRRWSTPEKIRLVEESRQPGSSVSFVARRYVLVYAMLCHKARIIQAADGDSSSSTATLSRALAPSLSATSAALTSVASRP